MTALVPDVLGTFQWVVLGYFVALNTIYLGLLFVASLEFARHYRRLGFAGHDDIFANPLTPAVSVLVPAFDEEAGIVDSVHAMLDLKYPVHEVVVVDDGSRDGTFAALQAAFDLVEVPRVVPDDVPVVGRVLSIHVAADGRPLVVARKTNGGKADALNLGIDLARHPLVCMVDADALLQHDALLRVAKPFVDDPLRVVATGGVVRPVNSSVVRRGRVGEARVPLALLPRIQVVEYLRAFLIGRTAWSRLGGLLIVSGAFGLFRRDAVVEVGGYARDCIGEDAELVVRLHRRLREAGRDYRVEFVAEPVCWTEVPRSLRVLGAQRRRWARGLAETLLRHRVMVGNPRYGRIGIVVLPYQLVFEVLGPVIELLGVVSVVVGLPLGLVDTDFAWRFAIVAIGYGVVLSLAAVAVEEFSFRHYRRWGDLLRVVVGAILENIGYRQAHAWWRLRGLLQALRGRQHEWGRMERAGFARGERTA